MSSFSLTEAVRALRAEVGAVLAEAESELFERARSLFELRSLLSESERETLSRELSEAEFEYRSALAFRELSGAELSEARRYYAEAVTVSESDFFDSDETDYLRSALNGDFSELSPDEARLFARRFDFGPSDAYEYGVGVFFGERFVDDAPEPIIFVGPIIETRR